MAYPDHRSAYLRSVIFSVTPNSFSTRPGMLDIPATLRPAPAIGDARVPRRVTMRLYPTTAQEQSLWQALQLHCHLYNAALEERIGAWQKAQKSISFADQCKSLTELRADLPEYRELNAQSLQVTLDRLDKAMKAFFRRVKAGEKAGFPRFKSLRRYPGWGYKSHGDGFTFTPGLGWRGGKLRLAGIGEIRCRGEARTPGEVTRADVQHKADGWYVSLVVMCEPHREVDPERGIEAYDWGVETWVTIGREASDGDPLKAEIVEIANPRLAIEAKTKAKQVQLARRKRGSQGYRRKAKEIARARKREADRRKDAIHKISAAMVKRCHTIITERLSPSQMTRSARGTVEDPGRNVQQKAGLNREILATAPAALFSTIACKAEEADTHMIVLETREEAPSQHCPACQGRKKKALSERIHVCEACGRKELRDHASVRWMLGVGTGWYGPPRPRGRAAGSRPKCQRAPITAVNRSTKPSPQPRKRLGDG